MTVVDRAVKEIIEQSRSSGVVTKNLLSEASSIVIGDVEAAGGNRSRILITGEGYNDLTSSTSPVDVHHVMCIIQVDLTEKFNQFKSL